MWSSTGWFSASSGPAIPWAARIVSVADVFDALSHDRPYRAALSIDNLCSGADINDRPLPMVEIISQKIPSTAAKAGNPNANHHQNSTVGGTAKTRTVPTRCRSRVL
jgi:hypothetical protein